MHKPKKVLFLTLHAFSLTGGIEQVCKILTRVLTDSKEEKKIADFHVLSLYDHLADPAYCDPTNFTGVSGNKVKFGWQLVKQARNADVIVLSHVHLLVFAALIYKLKPSQRIILLAHGIEVWQPLLAWKRNLMHKIESWAVSGFTAKRLQQQQGINPANIHILNNALDPFFTPPVYRAKPVALLEKYGLRKEQKVLLTICRLSNAEQYKGYDQVIPVLKDLIRTYPDLVYLLAGKADAAEKERIETLINIFGLEKHVVLTGFVPADELTAHYQLADVFVMPSKGEGFGLVFIEAAAQGCSLLAGNKDGSTDALLDGQLGTLVDPDDAEAIYSGLFNLLKSPLNANQVARQQQNVMDHFSYPVYKNNVQRLLANTARTI